MFVISQEINIFNSAVYEAIVKKDEKFIKNQIEASLKNGVDAIEINLGGWHSSDELLPWLVQVAKNLGNFPLFISPIPSSLKDAIENSGRNQVFINCVTADHDRLKSMISGAKCLGAGLVVLMTKKGFLPRSLDEICLLAEDVLELCEEKEFPLEKLIIDPVLRPRLAKNSSGEIINMPDVTFFAESIYLIGQLRPKKVHTIAGLSNLTKGLSPGYRQEFELSAIEIFKNAGLDFVILNSQTEKLVKKAKEEKSKRLKFSPIGFYATEIYSYDNIV